jgi:2-phosphoglycerate kinase
MAYDLTQATLSKPRDEIFMLVHGAAGVGKTTLAAGINNVFFLRTEDGTGTHEVPTYREQLRRLHGAAGVVSGKPHLPSAGDRFH